MDQIIENSPKPITPAVARSFLGGADDLEGGDLGALSGLEATLAADSLLPGEITQFHVAADFENFTGLNVTGLSALSSSDEGIATVSDSGLVTAVGQGNATLYGNYEGQEVMASVEVAAPPFPDAVLAYRYSFNEAFDSTILQDSVGGSHGEAINVSFSGAGTGDFFGDSYGYVNLPDGIISNLGANGTLEAWASYSSSGGAWQRLFDFGNTTSGEDPPLPSEGGNYSGEAAFFFAPRQGGINDNNGGRFAFDPGPGGENPQVDPPAGAGVPLDEEFHLVTEYNHAQRTASVWINGTLAAEGAVLADRPLSSLNDVNNWLGRSQWSGDAFATATFNEFRIYQGVRIPLQVAVNNTVGPDTLMEDPGPLQSLRVEVDATELPVSALSVPLQTIGDFLNLSDVDLSSVPEIEYASSDEGVLLVQGNPPVISPVSPGTSIVSATLDGIVGDVQITITAGEPATLVNRYSFDGNLTDSVGGKDGVGIYGSAAFADGSLVLDGTDNAYADLPDYLFSEHFFDVLPENQPTLTLEVFGHYAGGPTWQRILDFGNNTADVRGEFNPDDEYNGVSFLFLTPASGPGTLRLGLNDGVTGVDVDGGPAIAAGEDFYIAVVIDPISRGIKMYRDGGVVGTGAIPSNLSLGIDDVNTWLGRSNFRNDSFFNGSLSEFRIWTGALTPADIAMHAACGPDELECEVVVDPPEMSITQSGDNVVITWPVAAGFIAEASTSLGADADWVSINDQVVVEGSQASITLTGVSGNQFVRLRK